jgi:hypothetical protein
LDGLILADAFYPVIGIQSELKDSVEVLPEQGRVPFTPPDQLVDKRSLKG